MIKRKLTLSHQLSTPDYVCWDPYIHISVISIVPITYYEKNVWNWNWLSAIVSTSWLLSKGWQENCLVATYLVITFNNGPTAASEANNTGAPTAQPTPSNDWSSLIWLWLWFDIVSKLINYYVCANGWLLYCLQTTALVQSMVSIK